MKFLGLVLKNVRRNPIRSALTVGSLTISLALAMILVSFSTAGAEAARSVRGKNRVMVMSSQGFSRPVPYARVAEIAAMAGVQAVTPFSLYGGKYREEALPFAQFGVDPEKFFAIFDELTIPADQLRAWKEDRAGCIIGRKLADDRKIKVGDPLPLKDGVHPFPLDLTVRGIYDGPPNRDLRCCYFQWAYLDEGLKGNGGAGAGTAAILFLRCKEPGRMEAVAVGIDEASANSETPTRTQSEEAFTNMLLGMVGDLRWIIVSIGLAVGASLLCVSANAMAMALRERTAEVAVLRAIGFGGPLVISLVLAESLTIGAAGGLLGAVGCKVFCDVVDLSRYTGGMLPFFYVPWSTALGGLAVALGIGAFSGLFPALGAARSSVVDGLRRVV